MKLVTLLATVIITCTSCNSAQQKNTDNTTVGTEETMKQEKANPVFEYEASSRGVYRKIVLENQELRVVKQRGDAAKPEIQKLSDKDWKDLLADFKALDIKSIPNLKAPTEKRFYDGAAMGNFKIITGGETYVVPTFDHGFPPAAIEKIVNKLNTLAEKE